MSPSIVLGVLLGSIYGLLCHALVGRAWRQLPLYWLAGLVGFFAGFALSAAVGSNPIRLGTVPLVETTMTSIAGLAMLSWVLRRRGRAAAVERVAGRVVGGTGGGPR